MTRRLGLIPWRYNYFMSPENDLFESNFGEFNSPALWGGREDLIPAFDVSEKENEYVITGEIPGMDPKDFDITLSDGILTVKGEKKYQNEEKDEDYYLMERSYGSFQRSFRMPENVKTDKLDAIYREGILKIAIPKAEAKKEKKIDVKKAVTNKKTKKNKKA